MRSRIKFNTKFDWLADCSELPLCALSHLFSSIMAIASVRARTAWRHSNSPDERNGVRSADVKALSRHAQKRTINSLLVNFWTSHFDPYSTLGTCTVLFRTHASSCLGCWIKVRPDVFHYTICKKKSFGFSEIHIVFVAAYLWLKTPQSLLNITARKHHAYSIYLVSLGYIQNVLFKEYFILYPIVYVYYIFQINFPREEHFGVYYP